MNSSERRRKRGKRTIKIQTEEGKREEKEEKRR